MKDFEVKVRADQLEEPNPGELADGMPNLAGMGVKLKDVKTALATIDKPALKLQTLNRIKVRIWEEGDLVNGVALRNHPNPALREPIVKNLDAGGNIYLVFIDGRLVYNQWHIRNEGVAPVPDARLQEVVDDHIKGLAQGLFSDAVRAAVLKKL